MDGGTWLAVIGFFVLVGLAGMLVDSLQKARRSRAFDAKYGSLERVKEHVDVPALRAIRDERGEIHAVHQLRRQVPELALLQAVELVRGL